jgi:hypothetical protein
MEVYRVKKDMRIFCVKAESFPNDIKKAFAVLISLLPSTNGRTFFGVSYQSGSNEMIYHAGVLELFAGEGSLYGCTTLVIKEGEYLVESLKDWKKDESSIGQAFRKLADFRNDTTFPCVEWYNGDDVMCMVKIMEEEASNEMTLFEN